MYQDIEKLVPKPSFIRKRSFLQNQHTTRNKMSGCNDRYNYNKVKFYFTNIFLKLHKKRMQESFYIIKMLSPHDKIDGCNSLEYKYIYDKDGNLGICLIYKTPDDEYNDEYEYEYNHTKNNHIENKDTENKNTEHHHAESNHTKDTKYIELETYQLHNNYNYDTCGDTCGDACDSDADTELIDYTYEGNYESNRDLDSISNTDTEEMDSISNINDDTEEIVCEISSSSIYKSDSHVNDDYINKMFDKLLDYN
jgi:hypothetical protein